LMNVLSWIPKLQLPWRKRLSCILVSGEVEVWNGETHFKARNHFVEQGLIDLVNMLTVSYATGTLYSHVYTGYYTMRLGRNSTTPTTASLTALVDEVTTEPNSLLGENSNPTVGTVRIKVMATWNAGTVSGQVGELGLRWGLFTGLQSFGWTYSTSGTKLLMSRLSNADGDFVTFTINTGVPLTIEWRITFTFA